MGQSRFKITVLLHGIDADRDAPMGGASHRKDKRQDKPRINRVQSAGNKASIGHVEGMPANPGHHGFDPSAWVWRHERKSRVLEKSDLTTGR